MVLLRDAGSKHGRFRLGVIVVFSSLVGLLLAPSAPASTFVTLDNPEPAVEEVDGGGYKVSAGLTNITDQDVEVAVAPESPALSEGCGLSFGGDKTTSLPSASHSDVALTFNAGCEADDLDSVVLAAGPQPVQQVTLSPKDPTKPTPDWDQLWAFAYALGASLVLMAALALLVFRTRLDTELKYLADTWKLSDSLVTNITVVGGTLAGVLGTSDVIKAFLGKEADASIALTTVGAAVAAAIIGLGVVVLQATRKNLHFTVLGLLLAGAITLGGAGGELYVIWQNGKELTLGGWEGRLGWISAALALLLIIYAIRSLQETIAQGLHTDPPKLTLSADAIAATVLASRALGEASPANLLSEIQERLKEISAQPSEGAEEQAAEAGQVQTINIRMAVPSAVKSAML